MKKSYKIITLLILPIILFTMTTTIVNAGGGPIPEYTTTIKKIWNDEDNKYGKRPKSIEIEISQNRGGIIPIDNIVLNEENNWEVKYTTIGTPDTSPLILKELNPSIHYESSIPESCAVECTITNTIITKKITGKKEWVDENNKHGKRPESIKVYLVQDEKVLAETTTNEENNWEYEFTYLKNDDQGQEISYTVKEEKVENYKTEINGTNIKNTYIEKIEENTKEETYEKVENPSTSDNMHIILSSIIVSLLFVYISVKQYNSLKNL